MEKTKQQALGMLKSGSTVEQVATELGQSPALIREWYEGAEIEIINKLNHDIAVTVEASELINGELVVDDDKLKILENAVQEKGLEILKQMNYAVMTDIEQIRPLAIAAGIVTSLQATFFKTGPQIAIQNNNNTEAVSRFSRVLKA